MSETPANEGGQLSREERAEIKRKLDRERMRERVPAVCLNCNKEFMALRTAVERKGMGKYCSRACAGAHAKATKKHAGEKNPSWLGGVSSDNMRYRRRQIERHPVQEAARRAVRDAVRSGAMVRQPCEMCGAEKAQGHHDDYSKPLEVRWLCRKHHDEVHREQRAALNHCSSSDRSEGVLDVSRDSDGSSVTSGGATRNRTEDGGFADLCIDGIH